LYTQNGKTNLVCMFGPKGRVKTKRFKCLSLPDTAVGVTAIFLYAQRHADVTNNTGSVKYNIASRLMSRGGERKEVLIKGHHECASLFLWTGVAQSV